MGIEHQDDVSLRENAVDQEKKVPQVSIGMPVCNGEQSIRGALDSLLAQTFTKFELIISDNASTDSTESICREYAAKDSRIRYVRQAENLGALANFQFVLDEAVGEYFLWAAHDDEWNSSFVSNCIEELLRSNVAAVMPSPIEVRNRYADSSEIVEITKLAGTLVPDASAFIFQMSPSMTYGVFRRKSLLWFLEIDEPFDWLDCYVVLRTILHSGGYKTFRSESIYMAGIDSQGYVLKPFFPKKGRVFSYWRFMLEGSIAIMTAKQTTHIDRLLLLKLFTINRMSSFMHWEKEHRLSARIMHFFVKHVGRMRRRKLTSRIKE